MQQKGVRNGIGVVADGDEEIGVARPTSHRLLQSVLTQGILSKRSKDRGGFWYLMWRRFEAETHPDVRKRSSAPLKQPP
jgi:hypothetical protein